MSNQMNSSNIANAIFGYAYERPLEMPYSGKLAKPGALYDMRTGQISDYTLWKNEKLTDIKPSYSAHEFNVYINQSMDNTTESMNAGGGINTCGDGASGNWKSGSGTIGNESSITLEYICISSFKQLTMEHLAEGGVDYANVFYKDEATHVITRVEYKHRSNARLVFKQKLDDRSSNFSIDGSLKALHNVVSQLKGDVTVKIDESDKNIINKLEWSFQGDSALNCGTTASEAIEAIKKFIIEKKSEDANGTPSMIRLCPLWKLNDVMPALETIVNPPLACKIKKLINKFINIEKDITELKKPKCHDKIQDVQEEVEWFEEEQMPIFHKLKQRLAQCFSYVEATRTINGDEDKLTELLTDFSDQMKPFNSNMNEMKTKCSRLDEYIKASEENELVCVVFKKDELEKFIHDRKFPYVFCLSLDGITSKNANWFNDVKAGETLRHRIEMFCNFAKNNKNITNRAKFVISMCGKDSPNKTEIPGATVFLYEYGNEICKFPTEESDRTLDRTTLRNTVYPKTNSNV